MPIMYMHDLLVQFMRHAHVQNRKFGTGEKYPGAAWRRGQRPAVWRPPYYLIIAHNTVPFTGSSLILSNIYTAAPHAINSDQ